MRDFVFVGRAIVDEDRKYFRAYLRDIEDTDIDLRDSEKSMIPDKPPSVRGTLIYSEWQFRPVGPESTCVRVEVMIRPNGGLSAKSLEDFERTWPVSTVRKLRQQVLKNDIVPHEIYGGWVAASPESMITTDACLKGSLNPEGNSN